MNYFTKDFVEFFITLEKNNNTKWFHEHKSEYERFVKEPFSKLVDDVIIHIKQKEPEINISPKEAIFRINRDIRFSKDKSPYKTNVSAVVAKGGKKGKQNPGIFFMLGIDGIGIGGGVHAIDSSTLYKIRKYIKGHPEELDKLSKEKEFTKVYKDIKGEKNKVLPPEFRDTESKHPIIANKEFYYFAEYKDTNLIYKKDLLKFVLDHFEVALPLNNYFKRAMN